MSDRWLPETIQGWCDRMEQDTGQVPVVTQSANKYHLVLNHGRHRLTITWRLRRGEWRWAESTLKEDGVHRELAVDYEHLLMILRGEDLAKTYTVEDLTENGRLAMPPPAPVKQAPAMIRSMYERIKDTPNAEVVLTQYEGVYWAIFVDRGASWMVILQTPGQLRVLAVEDGVDRSEEVAGDVGKALRLLVPAQTQSVGSPAVAQAQAGARQNSVETRRATVIRT